MSPAIELEASGPARCALLRWRWRRRQFASVIVKASYALVDGGAMTVIPADDILRQGKMFPAAPSCIAAPSDFIPYRPRADITLARSPGVAPPAPGARFQLTRGGQLLVDHIAQSHDPADCNVGLGAVMSRGPIGELLRSLHTSDAPSTQLELPDDFDPAGFQVAPAMQRCSFLRGDEWVQLEGLVADRKVVRSRLAAVWAQGMLLDAKDPRGQPRELSFVADGLHIDADRLVASVTWRAVLPLDTLGPKLSIHTATSASGEPMRWPSAFTLAPSTSGPARRATLEISAWGLAAPLPFHAAHAGSQRPPVLRPEDLEPSDLGGTVALDSIDHRRAARTGAQLPFDGAFEDALPSIALPLDSMPALPERTGDAVPFVFDANGALEDQRLGSVTALTIPWQLRPPRDSLTVVVKATFDLVNGGPATLKAEADLPCGDVHLGDRASSGLSYASDFSLFKPRADVTLTGHVRPRPDASSTELVFRFGDGRNGFERRLIVFGERFWQRSGGGWRPTQASPFESLALDYAHAFGGSEHPANPIGIGHGAKNAEQIGARLPNLEDPTQLMRDPGDQPAPICFAPIPPTWRRRWARLGTYDDSWRKERWPYFAEDVDLALFQAAPPEQQVAEIAGDEAFEVSGLSPATPSLRGALPARRARCYSQRTAAAGGAFAEVQLRLDTVAFDTDAMKLNLVWRGVIEVSSDDAPELAAFFVLLEHHSEPTSLEQARARFSKQLELRHSKPQRLDEEDELLEQQRRAGHEAARVNEIEDRADAARLAEEEARLQKEAQAHSGMGGEAPDGNEPAAAPSAEESLSSLKSTLREAGMPEEEIAELLQASREPAEDEPAQAPDGDSARQTVLRRLAAGESLAGLQLEGADLSDLELSQQSLVGANLKRANLRGTKLRAADLSMALLSEADLCDADLSGALLELADLHACKLEGARFDGARMSRADLTDAQGQRASMLRVSGAYTRFANGQWSAARFDGATLDDADFSRASLDEASFDHATLARPRFHQATGSRVSFVDTKMRGARADDARFTKCSLSRADASGSVWVGAILDASTFSGGILRGANFVRASLRRSNLSGVDLSEGRMDRANLEGSDLSKSNLRATSLQHADLRGADLRHANLYSCNTFRADFAGAQLEDANITRSTLRMRA